MIKEVVPCIVHVSGINVLLDTTWKVVYTHPLRAIVIMLISHVLFDNPSLAVQECKQPADLSSGGL